MKKSLIVFIPVLLQFALFICPASAHPGTGIVVDKNGNVYFIHTGVGVAKISIDGSISYIHKEEGGHWLCLDEKGIFAKAQLKYFKRITPGGVIPAIIYAGGGSPIAINDGNLYYCGGQHGDLNPGAKTLVRETPQKQQTILWPDLEDTLNKLGDGITGIAAGANGTLYLACWNALIKVTLEGKVKTIVHPVSVIDCDEDPADHREANRGMPLLRGIAVDSGGMVYAAATSCHCLLRISPGGKVKTILKSERPWTPTGVAIYKDDIYVLEYTNANGPATEGWFPRVRKIDKAGKVMMVADLSRKH